MLFEWVVFLTTLTLFYLKSCSGKNLHQHVSVKLCREKTFHTFLRYYLRTHNRYLILLRTFQLMQDIIISPWRGLHDLTPRFFEITLKRVSLTHWNFGKTHFKFFWSITLLLHMMMSSLTMAMLILRSTPGWIGK